MGRKTEYLNQNQREVLGIEKNAISEIKFLLNEINGRFNNPEDQ